MKIILFLYFCFVGLIIFGGIPAAAFDVKCSGWAPNSVANRPGYPEYTGYYILPSAECELMADAPKGSQINIEYRPPCQDEDLSRHIPLTGRRFQIPKDLTGWLKVYIGNEFLENLWVFSPISPVCRQSESFQRNRDNPIPFTHHIADGSVQFGLADFHGDYYNEKYQYQIDIRSYHSDGNQILHSVAKTTFPEVPIPRYEYSRRHVERYMREIKDWLAFEHEGYFYVFTRLKTTDTFREYSSSHTKEYEASSRLWVVSFNIKGERNHLFGKDGVVSLEERVDGYYQQFSLDNRSFFGFLINRPDGSKQWSTVFMGYPEQESAGFVPLRAIDFTNGKAKLRTVLDRNALSALLERDCPRLTYSYDGAKKIIKSGQFSYQCGKSGICSDRQVNMDLKISDQHRDTSFYRIIMSMDERGIPSALDCGKNP